VSSPRTTRIGRRYQSASEFALSSVRGPVIRLGALIERDPSIAGFNIGVNCGAAAAQTAVTGRPNVIETVTFAGRDFSIQHDGVCRMNPQVARRMAQLALERWRRQRE
jgi:hypothetical protein